jgi:hypothetical protein
MNPQIYLPDWYKKAEYLANLAVLKSNIIWIKKRLLYAVHCDLVTGHVGVQK